jgi:hypothetical protein
MIETTSETKFKVADGSGGSVADKPAGQATLFKPDRKLWIYGVYLEDDILKHGEHLAEDRDGVIDYIVGKYFTGKGATFKEDDHVVAIIDMTSHAIKLDTKFDPNYAGQRKGSYDKEIQGDLPFDSGPKVNERGNRSHELFSYGVMPKDEVRVRFTNYHLGLLGARQDERQTYIARPFTNDADNKINHGKVKHLLAGCPRSGKETAMMALTIIISDKLQYSNDKISCWSATIPSTICEPLNELSKIRGMIVNGRFIDYNRLKIYIDRHWWDSNKDNLEAKARIWASENTQVIDRVEDIPAIHPAGQVPVMIAPYHRMAFDKKKDRQLRDEYRALIGRIGTMVIGEGHKFLKSVNRMWQILEQLEPEFLLPVTGTPYDLIFCDESSDLYFGPNERSIMTRDEMMAMKRANPTGEFKDIPDIHYYAMDEAIMEMIKECMEDPNYKPEDGHTFDKLITNYDPTKVGTKKFKYWPQILRYFKRVFSVSMTGVPDPMSIEGLTDLCDEAKKRGIVFLPPGSEQAGIKEIIKELVPLLQAHGGLGNYTGVAFYDEDDKTLKKLWESDQQVVGFTCIEGGTGLNLVKNGFSLVCRKIGNSLTWIEQAYEGRPSTGAEGKTNCAVILTELYNVANMKIKIEEKLSNERGEDKSHQKILDRHLANTFYYHMMDGAFKRIDTPQFAKELEKNITRNGYEVGLCVNHTSAPENFKLRFDEKQEPQGASVEVGETNNSITEQAKNKIREMIEEGDVQLQFDFVDPDDFDKSWNTMKKNHVSVMRIMGWIAGKETLQEVADMVCQAITDNDKDILGLLPGFQHIPDYINDSNEIDPIETGKFFTQLGMETDTDKIIDVISKDLHLFDEKKGDVRISKKLAQEFVNHLPLNCLSGKDKVLVPSVGKPRLLKGLYDKLISVGQSHEQIIERLMLFDRNRLNLKIVQKLFDLPEEICYNVKGDYIKYIENKMKNIKINFMPGNPPFGDYSKASEGKSKTGSNNTLYKAFYKLGHRLNVDTIALITQKGIMAELKSENKQVEIIHLMNDDNYWEGKKQYNTLFFVEHNQTKTSEPTYLGDSICNKMLGFRQWGETEKGPVDPANLEPGEIEAVVNTPIKKNGFKIETAFIKNPQAPKGWKFGYRLQSSKKSLMVTDLPWNAGESAHVKFGTEKCEPWAEQQAKAIMKFIENNPSVPYFKKKMNLKDTPKDIVRFMKRFDLSQIKTGFEYPKEFNFTQADIQKIENATRSK